MSAPGLAELRKRAVPGRCLCCTNPIGQGRRVLCGRPECGRLWARAWAVDDQKKHPERYGTAFYRAQGRRRPPEKRIRVSTPLRAKPPRLPRLGAGYFDVRAVPLLGNNGESYSQFLRRVERGWTRAEDER